MKKIKQEEIIDVLLLICMHIHKFCTHLFFKTKYFINQVSQLLQTNRDILYNNVNLLKFKANDLKGVQVMEKINQQCKSSSFILSNAPIKLKLVLHRVYIGKALIQI